MSDQKDQDVAESAQEDTFNEEGTYQNFLGLSDYVYGCIILLLASAVASVASIGYEISEDRGVSSNSVTLYAAISMSLLGLLLDVIYYYTGNKEEMPVMIYWSLQTFIFIFIAHCDIYIIYIKI